MEHKITLKVRLILYNRGKILLLQQTRKNGGNYTLVGGTVEENELPLQALIRESKEEAGIGLQEKNLQLAHVLHKRKKNEQRITLYFKANEWEGKLRSREPEKFRKVAWYPLNKLPLGLTDTVRHVLTKYRRGKLYSVFKD